MRIVFCGTPEFSVRPLKKLIANQYNVVAVYTQPDRGVGRGRKVQYSAVKECALKHNIKVYQPESLKNQDAIETLGSLKPDLLIVVAYGLILPKLVLDIPSISCWNIHASLLPRWRGAAPIHRAILAGDKTTGVGIMQMEVGLDTGAVYLQHECAIANDETTQKLHDKLAHMGASALIECLELLGKNLLPTPMVQDESLVTYAHKLNKSEAQLNWNESAENIDRKIRALVPWPGVRVEIKGDSYKIWQAQFVTENSNKTTGEVSQASKNTLFIQCTQGQLEILSIQKEATRTTAAQISYAVIYKKNNLSDVFKQRLSPAHLQESQAAIKALCFATIRHYLLLQDIWLTCLDKMPKDKMLRVILTQAMAEFKILQKPNHAIVNEAIKAAKKLNKKWATALINSCLRKAIEKTGFQASSTEAHYSHPQWWITQIQADWPQDWQNILEANNKKPPLWVRCKPDVAQSLKAQAHKYIADAYKISPQDITLLKEFQQGKLSVQDASAQLAGHIMAPQKNEKILDACAAPGGKTGHLLELNPHIVLDALELYPNRAKKIEDNLQRLNLHANIIVGDTSNPKQWFGTKKYDKILLDAPCSASGIIRRHPDIKYIREAQDIDNVCQDQQRLLDAVANLLKEGGRLLYATCSIFYRENSHQIKLFLKSHPQFAEIKLKYPFAKNCEYGIQIISGQDDMDGFYYCYLQKYATSQTSL